MIFKEYKTVEEDWQKYVSNGVILPQDEEVFQTTEFQRIKTVAFGISTICNLDCPFCFNHSTQNFHYYDPQGVYLDIKRMFKMLKDYCESIGILEEVSIEATGEPFIQKDIWQILEKLENFTHKIVITTNLQVKDKDLGKKLSQTKVKNLFVSCEASDEKTYEFLRRKGKLHRLCENLDKVKEETEISVYFNSIVFKENMDSLLGLPEFAQKHSVQGIFLLKPNLAPGVKLSCPSLPEFKIFLKKIKASCDRYNITLNLVPWWMLDRETAEIVGIDYNKYQRQCCHIVRGLQINPYGEIANCCQLEWLGKKKERTQNPFYCLNSLLELYNCLPLRQLTFMNLIGAFPSVCIEKCRKKISVRSVNEILKEKENSPILSLEWLLQQIPYKNKKIALYGGGNHTKDWLYIAKNSYKDFYKSIIAIVDDNPDCLCARLFNLPIIPPAKLPELQIDYLIPSSYDYENKIIQHLQEKFPLIKTIRIYTDERCKKFIRENSWMKIKEGHYE